MAKGLAVKFSTRVRFGLRIMIQIAAEGEKRPVFSRHLAETQGITEAYVDQILLPLRTQGLLVSRRGRAGGYSLARPAAEISLCDIIAAMEGGFTLVPCLQDEEKCVRPERCAAHAVWERLTASFRQAAQAFTLDKLAADYEALVRQYPTLGEAPKRH
ncbi:MAG: Rrf2 family transcriptional regulator [Lentisphaeria bacterium]|jgi:Rrf2 family protein